MGTMFKYRNQYKINLINLSLIYVIFINERRPSLSFTTTWSETLAQISTSKIIMSAIPILRRKSKLAEVSAYNETAETATMLRKKKSNVKYSREIGFIPKLLTKRTNTISVIAEYKRKILYLGFLVHLRFL